MNALGTAALLVSTRGGVSVFVCVCVWGGGGGGGASASELFQPAHNAQTDFEGDRVRTIAFLGNFSSGNFSSGNFSSGNFSSVPSPAPRPASATTIAVTVAVLGGAVLCALCFVVASTTRARKALCCLCRAYHDSALEAAKQRWPLAAELYDSFLLPLPGFTGENSPAGRTLIAAERTILAHLGVATLEGRSEDRAVARLASRAYALFAFNDDKTRLPPRRCCWLLAPRTADVLLLIGAISSLYYLVKRNSHSLSPLLVAQQLITPKKSELRSLRWVHRSCQRLHLRPPCLRTASSLMPSQTLADPARHSLHRHLVLLKSTLPHLRRYPYAWTLFSSKSIHSGHWL
jgi:hypothetical protein